MEVKVTDGVPGEVTHVEDEAVAPIGQAFLLRNRLGGEQHLRQQSVVVGGR